jgi:hypothetical protein
MLKGMLMGVSAAVMNYTEMEAKVWLGASFLRYSRLTVGFRSEKLRIMSPGALRLQPCRRLQMGRTASESIL